MKIYLVGGAVRDKLLGLPVSERDWVVVGATPEEMLARGFTQVGRDFPVFLHPQSKEEYALARTERKTSPGYKGFQVYASPEVTLEEDLLRRDLTINAMALDAEEQLIDPFQGQEDLRQGLLRHVSPAFTEDPVRILRAARFAARFAPWGFKVAHGTHALMKKMVAAGEVDALTAERVWKETQRALEEKHPARFFEVLQVCGALARIFPELAEIFKAEQTQRHAADSPALAVLRRVAEESPDPPVRFAALLSLAAADDAALIRRFCGRLRIPREYQELGQAARHCAKISRAEESLTAASALDFLQGIDAFRRPRRLAQLLPVCRTWNAPARRLEQLQAVYQAASLVNARAIAAAGLTGRAVGEELYRQRLAAAEEIF